MESYFQFFIKIAQVAIIVVILTIFSIRFKKGYSGYIFLILMLISGILQSIVEITFFILKINGIEVDIMYSLPIEHFFYSFTIIFLVMHFDSYLGLNYIPTITSAFILLPMWTSYFIDLKYDLGYFSFQPVYHLGIGRLWLFIFDIFQLYSVLYCTIAAVILFISALKTKVILQTTVITISTFGALVSSVLELLEHFIPNFEPYGGLTFGVSFLIMLLLYILDTNFVFYTPYSVYQIIVVHQNGQVIYNSRPDYQKTKIEEVVIGGIIYAFQSFVKELSNVNERQKLKYIQLDKRAVLSYAHNEILGLIIVDKYLPIFKISLNLFLSRFYLNFKDKIKTFSGNTSKFIKAEELAKQCFAYIIN